MAKNKSKSWIKKRHKIMKYITNIFSYPIIKLKYHAKITKCKDKRQYLILSNHQTDWDQFFIGQAFKTPIYYLASEDLFSMGVLSKIWRWLIGPIPIKKSTNDVRAVMNCLKVAKEGGTIAIFPEGNRTYSGATEYISPSIIKMAKIMKLPIAFFRIEGGYGVQPRWSNGTRKGSLKAYVSKIMEYSEYQNLSDDELYNLVKNELYVNEANDLLSYKFNRKAEFLERAIYVCPTCGISNFISNKNTITCKNCGKIIEYTDNKMLKGVNCDFEFNYVKEWYDYQSSYINNLDLSLFYKNSLFEDVVNVYNVELYKKKTKLFNNISLVAYGNKFLLKDKFLFFDNILSVSVLGRNKLNIYYENIVYQIKGNKRFNALKYVNIYYRYQQIKKGNENDKFLGL